MAFGATPILDDFTRANNATDPGGLWSYGGRLRAADKNLQITSNGIRGVASAPPYSAVFGRMPNSNDQEAYATIATIGNAGDVAEIWIRAADLNGLNIVDGYLARFTDNAAGSSTIQAYRCSDGAFTQIGSTFTGTIAAGEKFGIEAIGTTISAYHFTGGSWTQRCTGSDANFSYGQLALQISSPNNRLDDFGGTPMLPVPIRIDYSRFPKAGIARV